MLDVLNAPDHVVALRVSGRVEEQDIEVGIQAIEAGLHREDRLGVLVEVDITGMAVGAFAKDLTYSLSKLRDLHRFSRVAVVSNQEWVRVVAQVQARILPFLDVRSFRPSEREEAMAWVSQPPISADLSGAEGLSDRRSIRLLGATRSDVVAFEVDGRISGQDMVDLIARFDEALTAQERLRVLVRVVDFDGVSLEALRAESLWSVKMRGLKQIERYALVGGPNWMERVVRWATPLLPIKTRYFDRAEEPLAWDWLEASPA
jgi:hypothetical protein